MKIAALTLVGLGLGSMPFAVLLGRLVRRDIRQYGDGNPGAANAFLAGGWRLGVPAMLMDFMKGFAPVFVATGFLRVAGWSLVPVALAPVAGHAWSPWLRGRGGKALVVTFGIWSGITWWEAPVLLGTVFSLLRYGPRLRRDGVTVLLGMLTMFAYLAIRRPEPALFLLLGLNTVVLAWRHRHDFVLRRP